jgi:hypothetical protein
VLTLELVEGLTEVKIGTVLSFNETVLLLCVVVSAVVLFSKKMCPAAGKTVIVSDPLAVPV